MEKYVQKAYKLGAVSAKLININELILDSRTFLKCNFGCKSYGNQKCPSNTLKPWEAEKIIKKYKDVIVIHTHDKYLLSKIGLEIEKEAFLDGYYFAFALCACNLCEECLVKNGKLCPTPEKIRPSEHLLGIDVYATVRKLGLPINVLKSEEEEQNRYAFVLID